MNRLRFCPVQFLWPLLLVVSGATGQPVSSLQTTFAYDSTGTATVWQWVKPDSKAQFRPFIVGSAAYRQTPGGTLWLRFEVPPSTDTLERVCYVGRQSLMQLYVVNARGQVVQTSTGGTLSQWPHPDYLPDGYGLPFRQWPGQGYTVLVAIQSGLFFDGGLVQPTLYSPANYRLFKHDLFFRQRWLLLFYAFAIGGLFFGSTFGLFQYATRRDQALIYYAGVSFFSALMLIRVAEYNLEIRTLSFWLPHFFAYEYPLNAGAGACYLLFLRALLHLRKTAPPLYRLSNGLLAGLGLVFGLSFWFTPYLITRQTSLVVLVGLPFTTVFTAAVTGGVLLVVGLAYYRKLPLSGYFLTGLLLITAGYSAMLAAIFSHHSGAYSAGDLFWATPSIYLTMGILGEMLCFSLALGERTRQSERERVVLEIERAALEIEAGEALLRGQTQERRRVATELHDTLGGTLAAIKLLMNSLNAGELSAPEQTTYQQLVDMVGMAIRQMRHLAHNLLPDELAKQGLIPSLRTLFDNLNLNRQTHFTFTNEGVTQRFDKQTEFMLYAICLEACHNILKHAKATQATVNLVHQADKLHLLIGDNGVGFDMGADHTKAGMGLSNLYERTASLGGTLTVWSQPGEGAVVSLWVTVDTVAP